MGYRRFARVRPCFDIDSTTLSSGSLRLVDKQHCLPRRTCGRYITRPWCNGNTWRGLWSKVTDRYFRGERSRKGATRFSTRDEGETWSLRSLRAGFPTEEERVIERMVQKRFLLADDEIIFLSFFRERREKWKNCGVCVYVCACVKIFVAWKRYKFHWLLVNWTLMQDFLYAKEMDFWCFVIFENR